MKVREIKDVEKDASSLVEEAARAKRRSEVRLLGIDKSHPKYEAILDELELLRQYDPATYQKVLSLD